jgi:hypothetical protein
MTKAKKTVVKTNREAIHLMTLLINRNENIHCFSGLDVLNDDPDLVKVVESLTCGKIFAVEILDKSDIPLVVLYDTSGEDDININATCLKAICDKSLEVHLQVPLCHYYHLSHILCERRSSGKNVAD